MYGGILRREFVFAALVKLGYDGLRFVDGQNTCGLGNECIWREVDIYLFMCHQSSF